jgi:serine protease Do
VFATSFAARRSAFGLGAFGAALLMVAGLVVVAAPAIAKAAPDGFADLAHRLSPAVVNVASTQGVRRGGTQSSNPQGTPFDDLLKQFLDQDGRGTPPGARRAPGLGEGGPGGRLSSLGSGFVIDPKGIIITNYHVIANADEIMVNFEDGYSLKAKLIGHDELTDVAILKVEPKRRLTAVQFGDSDRSHVGDWVIAIGNPFGFGGSVTAGIISAFDRDIQAGPYDDFIQTDAAINRGNSGGPLFDLDGTVIGINTAIVSPTGGSIGLGFAIPSNIASHVVDQLMKFGETRRGWIGVRIQTVTLEIAESLGLEQPQGALVAEVTPGGPADKAGLKVGDLILKFDGKSVDAMRALPRLVAETDIGRTVQMEILRSGKHLTLTVVVGKLDEKQLSEAGRGRAPRNGLAPTPPSGDTSVVGLELSKLTPILRRDFGLGGNVEGIIITDVAPDSPAADELRAGDVIVEIDQQKLRSPEDVEARIKQAKAAHKTVILMTINRQGSLEFHGVRLEAR